MGIFSRFKVPSISAAQARDEVRDGAQLVDVREKSEWQVGHAPQAIHIPVSAVSSKINRIKEDRQVIVVCRSGNRSRGVVSTLRKQGYDNVVNLAGGMRAWQNAGGSVLDNKGRPGRIA
jgi:rhodanese-related sulfurtransferase